MSLYGNKILSLDKYFERFKESVSARKMDPEEELQHRMSFVGGFHAALIAVREIHKLDTNDMKNHEFNDLFEQVLDFAEGVVFADELWKIERKKHDNS